ncbi:MAG: Uma2 family endonuclease [Chloroflexota bacterium]|nr:Uma2 family endonuclease [Chloroflexota bacterium]
MASLPKPYYEPAEYLALERAAAYKSEYLAGGIYTTTGAGKTHNTIMLNIACELRSQFRGGLCQVYASEMRVQVQASGLYTYPDVLAVCGEEQFEDEHQDTLLNPTVIFEVLSPSTEHYDRGKKFALYRGLESLQEYLLVAQDEARVEHFIRHDRDWVLRDVADTIQFATIAAVLPLAAVYENVIFPPLP